MPELGEDRVGSGGASYDVAHLLHKIAAPEPENQPASAIANIRGFGPRLLEKTKRGIGLESRYGFTRLPVNENLPRLSLHH
jgi:hypothetical protein